MIDGVVVNIIGGLGNQMFQYAAGKGLASRKGWKLWLNCSEFKNYSLHNGFELNRIFSVNDPIIDEGILRRELGWVSHPNVQKAIGRFGLHSICPKRLLIERDYSFSHGIERIKPGTVLRGYWQSYKYFENQGEVIRDCFRFDEPKDEVNLRLLEMLSGKKVVSVHVRRGDYVLNRKNLSNFGVCPVGYYEDSINYLRERHENLTYMVFSDDPDWVKENLREIMPDMILVNHNRGSCSFRDMQLMSNASHNVIANSSFSWWGAWLNRNQGDVIAPKQWFASGIQTPDLIPDRWVRL